MARGIDTKPYLEWLDGVESTVSGNNTTEAIVVTAVALLIEDCGKSTGHAMTYVHLRLSSEHEKRTVLLPDIAFYRFESLDPSDDALPTVPPEFIVEVCSPNDRPGFREEKIRRYLAWNCPVVLDVDPVKRTIAVHDVGNTTLLREADRFEHPAVPWLCFDVRQAFERLDRFGF